MSAERVIPGRSKRGEHAAIVLHQLSHYSQDRGGVIKMFESVEGQYDVGFLVSLSNERAAIRDAALDSSLSGFLQSAFANLDADNFLCSSLCNFNCVVAVAATEVDHDFVFRLCPNPFAEQLFKFADAV